MRFVYGCLVALVILTTACRKGEDLTSDLNAKLVLSQDSVVFDTIFTALGSVTQRIKIINQNNKAIRIANVKLAGGDQSPFKLNVNGENTNSKNNLIVNGGDSINVFVKVTIDPNHNNLPFLVQDSILLQSNGNKKTVMLMAYGQNANYLDRSIISSNTTWSSSIPYVIKNAVTVKNGATLSIPAGTKVYFHTDASMIIEGKLQASGTPAQQVLFCSDRLENIYAEEPGQWKGIYLKAGGSGHIEFATIKNASVGITSDSLSYNNEPKLILSNTVVKNMQVAAYIGYHSQLLAFNNLFYNCGNYLIYGTGGGDYNLKQNTFAGFNRDFPRKTAALTFSDYLSASIQNPINIEMVNNIIWGNLTNELDVQKKTKAVSQQLISSNLIRTSNTAFSQNNNIINNDPQFVQADLANFQIQGNSPALKKGISLITDPYFTKYLSKDLKNNSRIFPSSLGCYEK